MHREHRKSAAGAAISAAEFHSAAHQATAAAGTTPAADDSDILQNDLELLQVRTLMLPILPSHLTGMQARPLGPALDAALSACNRTVIFAATEDVPGLPAAATRSRVTVARIAQITVWSSQGSPVQPQAVLQDNWSVVACPEGVLCKSVPPEPEEEPMPQWERVAEELQIAAGDEGLPCVFIDKKLLMMPGGDIYNVSTYTFGSGLESYACVKGI